METTLSEIFSQVQRYVIPIVSSTKGPGLSKEENRVLAFQYVNRMNHRIGYLARQNAKDPNDLKLLQTYVNNLTKGLKIDNVLLIKSALSSIRSMIPSIEKPSEKSST